MDRRSICYHTRVYKCRELAAMLFYCIYYVDIDVQVVYNMRKGCIYSNNKAKDIQEKRIMF